MAFTQDLQKQTQIRNRIRKILNEKIKNPDYTGEGYSGGISRKRRPLKKKKKLSNWQRFIKTYAAEQRQAGKKFTLKKAAREYKKRKKQRGLGYSGGCEF